MKRSLFVSENLDEESRSRVLNELKLGYLNLQDEMFKQAKLNFDIALQIDNTCAEAYWGLMLVKFQLKSEELLFTEAVQNKSVIFLPEYAKALEYANETQKKIYENLLERIRDINQGDLY